MESVYICDGIRTPVGRYGGALAGVRADDLAAVPIRALMERNPKVDWSSVDDLYFGCANQAGEDNRNVARMAALLAGLPVEVPACTVNRLCASGLEAVVAGARAIACDSAQLVIAGGVENMTRAPFVMGKAESSWSRAARLEDTTMGWRFVNPRMKELYGVDSMPETAENLARERGISRADQDAYALRSQQRYARALQRGYFNAEITPVVTSDRRGARNSVERDEHPRADTSAEALAALKPIVVADGTVTAGNSSGINDGAAAVLLAGAAAVQRYGLRPRARIVASAAAGVAPRIMGIGPVPAVQKLLARTGLSLSDIDLLELNEAFAAQVLAVTRALGLKDDADLVNPNGGAVAIGHPLGASGTRLVVTAINHLHDTGKRRAVCTLCIGVGQGLAVLLERV